MSNKISNMPGFAAEASLYNTSASYLFSAARGYSSGKPRVVSQFRRGSFGGFGKTPVLGFWDDVCFGACVVGCSALAPEFVVACIAACDLACY